MTDIRKTKEYKKMTSYLATGYAEGFEEAESETQVKAAWQYLVDTGLAWSLQGWFGRTANALIDEGIIERAKEDHKDYYGNLVKGTN